MIVVIGGFGSSTHYTQPFVTALLGHVEVNMLPIINVPLHHGYTLDQECVHVLHFIHFIHSIIPLPMYSRIKPITLIGFSTGCMVALRLSAMISVDQLVLCNPASIYHRLSQPVIDSLSFAVSNKTLSLTVVVIWLWRLFQLIAGPHHMAQIYYAWHGNSVNEPTPDELERVVFSSDLSALLTTIHECLIKPDIYQLIAQIPTGVNATDNTLTANANTKIHIMCGEHDYYAPFSVQLHQRHQERITLQYIEGKDHHMLYHHPAALALQVAQHLKK